MFTRHRTGERQHIALAQLERGLDMTFRLVVAAYALSFAGVAAAQTAAPIPATQPPANASTPDNGLTLRLICRGTGEHRVENYGTAFAFSGRGNSTAFGVGTQTNQFGDQMDIDIDAGTVRVRVPRRMLPKLHGGEGGWFDVGELLIGADEITGKVKLNFNEHPNLRIDRRSGSVALDGKVGSFAGQCEKVDPAQHAF
jgi:hypothetical protein